MDSLTALNRAYDACRRALAARTDIWGETGRPVFGEGPLCPLAMLVGEAPGAEETEAGRPFVGRAGKNLEGFLQAVELPRSALFVTNAVKYRPFRTGASGRKSNRTPTKAELEAGRALLLEEIRLVRPGLIVTLGNSPLFALTGHGDVGARHGTLIPSPQGDIFALYHPASLIYRPSLSEVYRQDMEKLSALLRRRAGGPSGF